MRKSSSKLLNQEKNGGQRNWFRKKSRIGPAASTNQIRPFSYWLCESRIGSEFFVLALFSGIIVFQFLIQVKLNLHTCYMYIFVNFWCK